MYFNAAEKVARMILIVIAVIALYESINYLVYLITENKSRYSMVTLFGSASFARYYSFWMYINHYNDDFYSLFYHQLFLTV